MDRMSRAHLWGSIDTPQHIVLIDDALDRNDEEHREIRAEFKAHLDKLTATVEAGFEKWETASTHHGRLLVSILVALVVAAVTLALNVIVFGTPS